MIDVAGGDKVPRKGGPGITQSDLLVINKTDLAPAVGADLAVMDRDARAMRGDGPFVFAQVKHGVGVEEIVGHILANWRQSTNGCAQGADVAPSPRGLARTRRRGHFAVTTADAVRVRIHTKTESLTGGSIEAAGVANETVAAPQEGRTRPGFDLDRSA